nr:hypothetical protein [uncultured organism]
MKQYRAAIFLDRSGAWRATRDEAMRDAVEMDGGRVDRDGRTYLNPGVRIEEMEWKPLT